MSINQQSEGGARRRRAASAGRPPTAVPESELSPTLAGQLKVEGERWGDEVLRDVRSQQRRVRGGWPGTMGQARERLWFYVLRGRESLEFATEQALAARYLYRIARARWNAAQDHDLSDDDE